MSTVIPMSHPAIAVKNGDGTWSVRIQHTTEGAVSMVDFGNVVFAEQLAKAYAAGLNGKAVIDVKITKAASDIEQIIPDIKNDTEKAIAEARMTASTIIDAAVAEAKEIKTQAENLLKAMKVEAEKLLADAKAEAEKVVKASMAAVSAFKETEAPPPPSAPAAKVEVTTKPKAVEED